MDWKRFSNPWAQQPPRANRLMSRDGKLFIVSEYAQDEPGKIQVLWYPTGVRMHTYFDVFPPEGFPARSEDNGVYSADTGYPRRFQIRLTQGGRTTAEYVEARIVPPPPKRGHRVELQWSGSRGVWEKASKSTKWQWVPA